MLRSLHSLWRPVMGSTAGEASTAGALALDSLAVIAMVADIGRRFSAAELAPTSQRHSTKPETLPSLEQLQYPGNWIRGGGIQMGGSTRPDGRGRLWRARAS